MNNPISIVSLSSISSLGSSSQEIWERYLDNKSDISSIKIGDQLAYAAQMSDEVKQGIEKLKEDKKYRSLDHSVLFAIFAARCAVKNAKWTSTDHFGVNIGSSRGAAQLYEDGYELFLKSKIVEPLSSPTTTLGNISSWVAQDLQTNGPQISHSVTCSTALHALLNGVAWINSGMSNKFLVGGSEAPLTPFTVAQMQALKIYSKVKGKSDFPCRALDPMKESNSMVLGEAASMACLEPGIQQNALAIIEGVGFATEILTHSVSLSDQADCFQASMKMALGKNKPKDVDVIVTHSPGTIKGDSAELKAIATIFSNTSPIVTTNKWKVGHTLGASGMLSVEMAVLMLQNQTVILPPYLPNRKETKSLRKIMINAVGFGGNAVSVLISKNDN